MENLGTSEQYALHSHRCTTFSTKTPGKGGTNKSEWCKRSWRVSNWAIWKHPIILWLKYQKSLFKGEEKVLGVKLWTTFVRNSQNAFDGKWTRTSGTCLHELCLIAEWRWVVYVDLRCMNAVLSYNVTFNCYDTFVVILGDYSDTVIYGWVKKQRWGQTLCRELL